MNRVEGTRPLTVEWKGEGEKSGPVKCWEWGLDADEVVGLDVTGDPSGILMIGAFCPDGVGGSELIGVALDIVTADS